MSDLEIRLCAMTSWRSIFTMLAGVPFAVALLLVIEWLKSAEISSLGIEIVFYEFLINYAYEEALAILLGFVWLAWKNTASVIKFLDRVCA